MRRRSPRRKRHAVAVEEFEDLDRDLAAVVEPVAELRGGELALRGLRRDVGDDLDHLGDRVAQEEMIVRDLVDLAHAAEQLEQAPDLRLRHREQPGDVAHARRTEALAAAEQRRGSRAQSFSSAA